MIRYTKEQVETLIEKQPEGTNTKFLKAAHNLWFRFKNYEKHSPFVLEENNEVVALVFITFSARSKYANLYEIVTLEGQEGKGYASKIYWQVMEEACLQGMQRLKMSCTPTSVTWHKKNGTIFWAVDPSGSLRVDQLIFRNKEAQLSHREFCLNNRLTALPPEKARQQFANEGPEDHGFGEKKMAKVNKAIEDVQPYWFRESLSLAENTLEEFLG